MVVVVVVARKRLGDVDVCMPMVQVCDPYVGTAALSIVALLAALYWQCLGTNTFTRPA